MSNTTEDIIYVRNTYINGATLPVFLPEQGGAMGATEVVTFTYIHTKFINDTLGLKDI